MKISLPGPLHRRLSLAASALFKRDYYRDVFALAREGEMGYRDVAADVDPFQLLGLQDQLDFSSVPDTSKFLCPHDPVGFVSERSVSRFLARLVVHRRARVIVELGCFIGVTTAHLALAAARVGSDAHVYAADLSTDLSIRARKNLVGLTGAEQTTFMAGDASSSAILASLPPLLDLVFIDTSHDYLSTVREIDTYGARLSPGGCLVLHDSLSFAGVRKAVEYAAARHHVCTFATEQGNGLTILLPRTYS